MTAPLVPPDVVIPRLPWVPIYADRLWESDFFAVATDAEFRAAFCLWLKSWSQKPPGSLPTDDRMLCRLAELGGDLAKWRKVKRIALRHWIECDDGRLYHPVVAELVLDAVNRLDKKRQRTEAARAAALSNRLSNRAGDSRADSTKTGQPLLNPPRDGGGDLLASLNGKGGAAEPPPPINPKFLNHGDRCQCRNCTRWAAMHNPPEQRSA